MKQQGRLRIVVEKNPDHPSFDWLVQLENGVETGRIPAVVFSEGQLNKLWEIQRKAESEQQNTTGAE